MQPESGNSTNAASVYFLNLFQWANSLLPLTEIKQCQAAATDVVLWMATPLNNYCFQNSRRDNNGNFKQNC